MLPIRLLAFTVLIASVGNGAVAQDNPLNGIPPAGGRTNSEEAAQPDPFADQLMNLAGRGNRQMATAIASLARTERWPEVNQLLERLSARKLNNLELAKMQDAIEPAVFLEMRLNDQLSERAQATLDQLAAATKQYRQSPERLREAISSLDDPSTDKQLAASRVLVNGGNAAIVELVAAAIAAQPPADRDAILRAMLRLGDGGSEALRQLALYGTQEARTGAVTALARISPLDNVVDLLTTQHASDSSAEAVSIASEALRRVNGRTASRALALKLLIDDLRRKQRVAEELENTDDVLTNWSVNSKRDGVNHTKTLATFSAYRDVADAAARLRRVGGFTPEITSESLIADMGYRTLIDPDWGDPVQVQNVMAVYGSALNAAVVNEALARAIELQDHAASIGLIRLIEAIGKASGGQAFLFGNGAAVMPLVAAASSAEPRVRYEAALAASRVGEGLPYPGSSQVKRSLSEMTRLGDLPTAVIVETRPEVIAPMQRILAQMGFRGEVVHNVSQLQKCVDRGGDIRLIAAKTQLADLPPIELIDVIRRNSRGKELPIVFFSDDVIAPEGLNPDQLGVNAKRWDGPTTWIQQPTSPAAFTAILAQIDRHRRLPHLTALDRKEFRSLAAPALAGGQTE